MPTKQDHINNLNKDLISAKYLYAKSSARKLRILANLIRGKNVEEVLINLNYINTKAAFLIKKVIYSAVANARNYYNIKEVNNFLVKNIIVNEGPKNRKFFPRAKGKTDFIEKKTSHIIIELTKLNIKNTTNRNGKIWDKK